MKNTNESGRSMVEMLGVLAIIGVLSIGGIAGYTLAMNRYRANEILNAAALVSIAATSAEGGVGNTKNLAELEGVGTMTLPGIETNDDITGYRNGVVKIVVNSDYARAANIVKTLSGDRLTTGSDATCTQGKDCTIYVNVARSVKNGSTQAP
ncbi:MAG: hypothetical protein SPL08_00150 [Pseudomonadota bacterium]|nr:hypothetical protein [Pseudomonadota bacterium]